MKPRNPFLLIISKFTSTDNLKNAGRPATYTDFVCISQQWLIITVSMPRSITMQEKHPELFARDQYVDPASRKRLVPMEVLCLGYMRTGTACKYQPVE